MKIPLLKGWRFQNQRSRWGQNSPRPLSKAAAHPTRARRPPVGADGSAGQFLPSRARQLWWMGELPSTCTVSSPPSLAGANAISLGQIVALDGCSRHTAAFFKESFASTNYVLPRNGFSHTALGSYGFSCGTCRNINHIFNDNEVPRSRWLLMEQSRVLKSLLKSSYKPPVFLILSCLQSLTEAKRKIKWAKVTIFRIKNTNNFFLTSPSTYCG